MVRPVSVKLPSVLRANHKPRRVNEEVVINDGTIAVGVVIGGWVTFFVVWAVLNIVGTIYFTKVIKFNPTFLDKNGMRGGQYAALFLGWFANPLVNLCAPFTYLINNKEYGSGTFK